MKFHIRNASTVGTRIPDATARIKELLDALPDGELRTYADLEADLNLGRSAVQHAKAHAALRGYWTHGVVSTDTLVGCRQMCLFGNPATVAAYKEEFGR